MDFEIYFKPMTRLVSLFFLILLSLNFSSALFIAPDSINSDVKIERITTYSSIEGNDLYSDIILELWIYNKSLSGSDQSTFHVSVFVGEPGRDRPITADNLSAVFCDNPSGIGSSYTIHLHLPAIIRLEKILVNLEIR